jgi:hypothetical protein
MTRYSLLCLALIALFVSRPARADDQQKAQKQLHKLTAMSTDATGLRVVNLTVAESVNAKRVDLVQERRDMGISYGDLYIAHTLTKNGAKMEDIAAQVKSAKKMEQIANDLHLDWKQMSADAKKLNTTMENNLYKFFVNMRAELDRDKADNYDPMFDVQKADSEVSKEELADAQNTYSIWKDRATQAKGGKLDQATENAARGARGDPINNAGPQSNSSSNTTNTTPK